MDQYEVVTGFYTIVPWLSGGFIIFGIVTAIALSIVLGWWVGAKSAKKKTVNLWLAFGWIPIFGIFIGSVFTGGTIYYAARTNLSDQIELQSGIEVVTFIRGNDHAFVGTKENKLTTCHLEEQEFSDRYKINCP